MFSARLRCSFCQKSAAEVSKLVAGPNVYICDVCAAEVHRIMSDPSIGAGPSSPQASPSIWRRMGAWFGRRMRGIEASRLTGDATVL